jgi:hypothetical protein
VGAPPRAAAATLTRFGRQRQFLTISGAASYSRCSLQSLRTLLLTSISL